MRKIFFGLLIFILGINFTNGKAYTISNKPYLSIVGLVKNNDGIGRIAPELTSALSEEIDLELFPTRKIFYNDLPSSVLNKLSKNRKPAGKIIFFCDNLTPHAKKMYKKFYSKGRNDKLHIAYTTFESTMIPTEWVEVLNANFDAVAVPDIFLVDVFKNCGVQIPVFELPHGMNLTTFLEHPLKLTKQNPLVFGSFSSAIDRKNILTLVRAFVKAFGINNENVSLLINCRYGDKETISLIEEEIKTLGSNNISFKCECVSNQDYIKLYESIDVYVSLSKGEGFSFQPREAMALGIPVIITDNTAQSTICRSNLVKVVSSNIKEQAVYSFALNGKPIYGENFNCTIEDAAAAMLNVYYNYDTYLEKRQEMKDWVRRYDYNNQKDVFKNFFLPKKIILGDKNEITSEFVKTNSQHLLTKWRKIAQIND